MTPEKAQRTASKSHGQSDHQLPGKCPQVGHILHVPDGLHQLVDARRVEHVAGQSAELRLDPGLAPTDRRETQVCLGHAGAELAVVAQRD